MDNNAPATKGDIAELRTEFRSELRGELRSLQTSLMEELGKLEVRLTAHVEHIETRLLSAFHGWARTTEVKMRSSKDMLNAVEERLDIVEERISRIERGDNGRTKTT